jgi:hypothetical protein
MDIEEIPINSNIIEDTQDNTPDIQNNTEDIPEIIKKSRGRPAGAKNKAKAAPKQPVNKPAPKRKNTPIYDDESDEEESTPPPRRSKRQQIEPEAPVFDRHALASDVLGILQQQRYQKTTARRQHYAGWFANMS